MGVPDPWPQFRRDIVYGKASNLNTLQTCIPRPTSANDQKRIWIVYVHGGAWFDPGQTATTFDKAQDLLLNSSIIEHVAGFASINYRLSPAPRQSTNSSHPSDPARSARHPDHINDVLAGILHLQETYRFEGRYLLVGHSCGACLALQVAMKRHWRAQDGSTSTLDLNVVPPLAILGLEGLYDLPALVQYHSDGTFYHDFIAAAFGPEKADWKAASPTSADLDRSWEEGKLIVIAHSHEDELVEWEQPELMMKSLLSQGFTDSGPRRAKLLELKGKHDQVWEEGPEVARAIEFAVKEFIGMRVI